MQTWKIRSQDIRNLFFKMRLFLKLKIKTIVNYLDISKSTLYRWLKEGSEKPINPTRIIGKSKINYVKEDFLNFIKKNNTFTLKEFSFYLFNNFKIKVSISTIHKFCIQNNITYKKATINFSEADSEKTRIFLKDIKSISLNNCVILDEASFLLNHSKKYARSLKGQRAFISKPGKRIKRYSLLLSMNHNKILNWKLFEGSVDSVKFRSFIEQIMNGSMVVMDNARIHHSTNALISKGLSTIKELSISKNLTLNYLPPYQPQLNPVEFCFNIIRTFINKKCPRNFKDLENNLKLAIESISSKICNLIVKKVWF